MDEIKIKKLEALMSAIDIDTPSTQEVADLIAQIIEVVRQAKEFLEKQARENKLELNSQVNRSFEEAVRRLDEFGRELEKKNNGSIKDIRAELDSLTKNLYLELKKVKDLIPEVNYEEIYAKIKEVEDKIVPFKLSAEEVRDKLEFLKDDDRLDKSAIKGLEDEIKQLRKEISSRPSGGGGSRRVFQPYRDNFTTQTDGSTKTFYLNRAPLSDVVFVFGTDFPRIYNPTTDFTVANKVLTLTAAVPAPTSGATLIVEYFS